MNELILGLLTFILLFLLKEISRIAIQQTIIRFSYIVLVLGFIGGNYYSIFMSGRLLFTPSFLTGFDFEDSLLVRWLSILVCPYLGFLIPKHSEDG